MHLGNLGNVHHAQGQYDLAITYITQSLDIAREIGDKRSECINLGNLGDALFKRGRLDEAETVLREAISIGEQAFPVAAGAFRASLALLLAHQGKYDEFKVLFETGEPQVEPYPDEHTKFLCKKGQVSLLAGDSMGAVAALKQAQAITAELDLGSESELMKVVVELAHLLTEEQ